MEIFTSSKIKINYLNQIQDFFNGQIKRLYQGHTRYGTPDRRKNYMTRMILEVKAYRKSGNAEQLYNIANYALLEHMCPENKKYHFDNMVGSVTRDQM